ncbi:MAG: hypothetical protein U1E65_33675 [Myxococcota bacterium]
MSPFFRKAAGAGLTLIGALLFAVSLEGAPERAALTQKLAAMFFIPGAALLAWAWLTRHQPFEPPENAIHLDTGRLILDISESMKEADLAANPRDAFGLVEPDDIPPRPWAVHPIHLRHYRTQLRAALTGTAFVASLLVIEGGRRAYGQATAGTFDLHLLLWLSSLLLGGWMLVGLQREHRKYREKLKAFEACAAHGEIQWAEVVKQSAKQLNVEVEFRRPDNGALEVDVIPAAPLLSTADAVPRVAVISSPAVPGRYLVLNRRLWPFCQRESDAD